MIDNYHIQPKLPKLPKPRTLDEDDIWLSPTLIDTTLNQFSRVGGSIYYKFCLRIVNF